MLFYRQYFLNFSDRICGMKEFNSPDDATAIQVADRNSNGVAYELWELDRLVQRQDTMQIAGRK